MAEYKQRYRTYPQRISFEALNEGVKLNMISTAAKQKMFCLFHLDIAIMLSFLLGDDRAPWP